MESLFPLGIEQYLIGGLLVGLGISFVYIMTGLVSGVSTTSTWSFFSRDTTSFFRREKISRFTNLASFFGHWLDAWWSCISCFLSTEVNLQSLHFQ